MFHSTCKMLHNTCTMLQSTCKMLHNTCMMLHNTFMKLHNTCKMLHHTCKMVHHTCKMLHNTCKMLHNTYKTLHSTLEMCHNHPILWIRWLCHIVYCVQKMQTEWQTVQTLIRLLLQSDLVQHCFPDLSVWKLRSITVYTKQSTICHIKVNKHFKLSHIWENLFMPYANNKGADQPVHPLSLINAFVVCCLDSIIPLLAVSQNSRLWL